jgi:hypothetical protein
MAWHWVGEPTTTDELNRSWSSQGDAETWLGAYYLELWRAGVRAVSLFEEDRLVYGPMPLEPEVS